MSEMIRSSRLNPASVEPVRKPDTEEPPSGRAGATPRRALTPAEAGIRELSERLGAAGRSLRILDAVRWDDEVEERFFAAGCTELPRVDRDWYRNRPLPFDPASKREELARLEKDLSARLGSRHPAGRILLRACAQLRDVASLLAQRGTTAFTALSRRLYGSSRDPLPQGAPSLAEMARCLTGAVCSTEVTEEPTLDAPAAGRLLAERLTDYFGDAVCVQVSPDLAADAAVVGDALKVRDDARFSLRDVYLLEVHEGWVHLGTTRNGLRQPVCTFLSRATPAATVTQEGLAVLTEVLAFASHPARLRRLANRVAAVALAEEGADFLDVFRFFAQQGCSSRESYQHTARIFRGSLPHGCGPFTKDLAYSKGFVGVYHHLRQAVARGEAKRIPLLFCGKTCLEDMDDLAELADAGVLLPPRRVPPPFADLRSLAAWVAFVACLHPSSVSSSGTDVPRQS
jgi:uncharacterized protein (TIGR02421 family)